MSRSQPLCPAAELPPGKTRKFIFTHEGIRREKKNQWGFRGYCSQRAVVTELTARLVLLT